MRRSSLTTLLCEPSPIRPAGIRKAIADALRAEDLEFSSTRWSVARLATPPHSPWGGVRIGNRLIVSQTIEVAASPATAFAPDTANRRLGRLVLRPLVVGAARTRRPVTWGRGNAARAVQRGNDRGRRPD